MDSIINELEEISVMLWKLSRTMLLLSDEIEDLNCTSQRTGCVGRADIVEGVHSVCTDMSIEAERRLDEAIKRLFEQRKEKVA